MPSEHFRCLIPPVGLFFGRSNYDLLPSPTTNADVSFRNVVDLVGNFSVLSSGLTCFH